MSRPSLSIIIPTFQREAVLCETIESVMTHTRNDVQVVVVDQTPHHEESTKRFLRDAAKHRRFVHRFEPTPNLPRARNVGIALSSGMLLLFLDDDVLIHNYFVEAHLRHYENEQLAAVTGRIVFPDEDPNDAPPLAIDPKSAVTRLDLQIMRYRTPLRNPLHFVGANMSFRRCWLETIRGFSHRFTGSALGEEIELIGRLRRAGGRTLYDPEAWLIHRVEQTGGCRSSGKAFPRQRDRMRNYYYALYHGLGAIQGSQQAAARWNRGLQPITANKASAPSRSGNRWSSAAGRFLGSIEGIADSIRYSGEQGNLATISLAKAPFHKPTLSVVVPTYNRPQEILTVVRCLAEHAPPSTEIVIIDQSANGNPELDSLLMEVSTRRKIRYLRQRQPNASRARNTGVAHCSGDVILFLDDDTTFDAALLRQHLAAHGKGNVAIVGGRILWPGENPDTPKPLRISTREARNQIEAPVCYHSTPVTQALHLITCNMSVRRDWFVRSGGFNERLPGGGEDLEFVARVRRMRGRILYEPRAWLYHHNAPSGGIRINLQRPFLHGFRRGRANHYATLRAVGIMGWLTNSLRRTVAMLRRALHDTHGYGSVQGPVQEMRSSRSRGRLSKWSAILTYKALQILGSLCSIPVSVSWCIQDRSRGGDYKSDGRGPIR